MSKPKHKLLVIGQTPPPYGGQALMTQRLVNATFSGFEVIHIRLNFSTSFLEVGKASLSKVIHLFEIIFRVWLVRIKNRNVILYYMPAGPNSVPVIRDLLLLAFIRPVFSQTIFHFRAAGISHFIKSKSKFFQFLCKKIYGRPTVGIQLSSLNPSDAAFFSSKSIFYVPNGLEDKLNSIHKRDELTIHNKDKNEINILFVGVLREDKGFTWLIESLHLLKTKGISNFVLTVVGEFNSKTYEKKVKDLIKQCALCENVNFLGVLTGEKKWKCFEVADLLCFPTFFDCESFGNVLIEAFMFELPVIGSEWRGIPDIISDDVGFLVEIKNIEQLAEKIALLIKNETLRKALGQNARRRYIENYTLDKYLNRMEHIIENIK